MPKIYSNLLATDRMLKRLEADKFFAVKDLEDSETIIPMITLAVVDTGTRQNGTNTNC